MFRWNNTIRVPEHQVVMFLFLFLTTTLQAIIVCKRRILVSEFGKLQLSQMNQWECQRREERVFFCRFLNFMRDKDIIRALEPLREITPISHSLSKILFAKQTRDSLLLTPISPICRGILRHRRGKHVFLILSQTLSVELQPKNA
jgi:hypothetical protein